MGESFMRIVSFALIAGLVLAGCQSGQTDSGGTPMTIDEQNSTIHSAVSWLPEPIVRWSETYTYSLRDNTHPIVDIKLEGTRGYYEGQYIREYYELFSRGTAQRIQDEAEFRNWLNRVGISETLIEEFVKVGNPYSRTGGWYGLFGGGDQQNCVIANVGAGLTTYASQGAPSGMPYDSIYRILYCGTMEERDQVIDFILSPQSAEDRAAFRAYVDTVQQEG